VSKKIGRFGRSDMALRRRNTENPMLYLCSLKENIETHYCQKRNPAVNLKPRIENVTFGNKNMKQVIMS